MQRRWIREIKIRVEQERGGRLSKLDELAANIKRLERITLDNSSYLDENIRVHSLWSVIRALNNVIEAPARRPFRDELRVLRHINAAKEEPLVAAALESLEKTDTPDIGIEPFADLASWFSTSVAPNLTRVALVPDQDAGVLSHLASYILSSFRFRRHGLVPGSDVLSVLARTEYYMNEKDLDSAARELNQLKGTAKVLLSDWLDAARRRLEVLQALEVRHCLFLHGSQCETVFTTGYTSTGNSSFVKYLVEDLSRHNKYGQTYTKLDLPWCRVDCTFTYHLSSSHDSLALCTHDVSLKQAPMNNMHTWILSVSCPSGVTGPLVTFTRPGKIDAPTCRLK